MLRLAIVFLALACGASVATGADIRIVESWVQYRDVLRSEGKSEAEIDAEIASDFAGLKAMDRYAGNDRIGVAAPPFQFDAWLNTPPLLLEDLRGRVVLVRWWTDTCPFCAMISSMSHACSVQWRVGSSCSRWPLTGTGGIGRSWNGG
jgi:hypothetical protein